MSTRVIIERADTGARASVVEAEFAKAYPDVAYTVIGEETPADFIVTGVPAPATRRGSARPKATAKARAAKAAQKPIASEPAAE